MFSHVGQVPLWEENMCEGVRGLKDLQKIRLTDPVDIPIFSYCLKLPVLLSYRFEDIALGSTDQKLLN